MIRRLRILWTSVAAIGGVVVLFMAFVYYAVSQGLPVSPARAGTIKVACVGDSITFGDIVFDSKRYPRKLEDLLGSAYSVRNFGAPGFTAQKSGDHPYWEHGHFKRSSEFEPDIVLLMLGTNDSKTQNWAGFTRFAQDYRALIQHYQSLPSRPRIVLMTPPSVFLLRDQQALAFGVGAQAVAKIAVGVKQIAAELGLPIVDIYSATALHPEYFAEDGIHPDEDGARLIANAMYAAVSNGAMTP